MLQELVDPHVLLRELEDGVVGVEDGVDGVAEDSRNEHSLKKFESKNK